VADSLVLGEQIELIGAGGAAIDPYGTPSSNPLCTGTVFRLLAPAAAVGSPSWNLGAPQPTTDIVGSLLLDGERPFGYRAGNRTITLPVIIKAPSFQELAAAREILLKEVDQQTWTLRWTRDTAGPLAGNTVALPLLFDCFRAQPSVYEWGGFYHKIPYGIISLTFQALPYGRSDMAQVIDFPAPLSGRTAPPAAINVDTFSSVSGTQWSASSQSPNQTQSAYWDPGASPANDPTGTGVAASYSKTGLSLNIAAGWDSAATANGTTTTITVASSWAGNTGDQFQLWASGSLKENTIFTVASVTEPSGGNVTLTFSPAAAATTATTNHAIQTAPPQLRALTLWAGFGSANYYPQWARLGGRITFGFTLTDTYSTVISFSATVKAYGSNQASRPRWQRVRVPIPYVPAFDYQNVTAYSVTVTNRGTADLRYTNLYLSALQAAPTPNLDPNSPALSSGAVYELVGVQGTARSPMSVQAQQPGTVTVTRQFATAGTFGWVCPPGVSSVNGYVVGGGGPGGTVGAALSYCGGGGGGGSAQATAMAVTAGKTYTVTVGYGGTTGAAPSSGTSSSFTGDAATITGGGGGHATYNGTTAGSGGASGTGGFTGGAGGAGSGSGVGPAGGGGGSSAGSAAGGNAGAASTAGGAGGAAVTGGGAGGNGGVLAGSAGHAGVQPGGGGGGGRPHVSGEPGGNGAPGIVQLTYTSPATFQTLVLHRPPPAAPESLSPDLPVYSQDTPNGSVAYNLYALGGPGIFARPRGTYTVAVVAYAWNSASAARTITVTVTQYEQAGGASYTTSAAVTVTPDTLPNTAGTNAQYGPIVIVGEITLPVNDLPQDNLDAYFTASITDTNTSDSFQDILFLDTMGSTVIIMSPTAYANYFIDEPGSDRDIGLVMGSVYDRADAVSVLDRATVSGQTLAVIPDGTGNPYLLAYCAEGAPNIQVSYFPRWFLDRYQ
jgi:hypothetical protein